MHGVKPFDVISDDEGEALRLPDDHEIFSSTDSAVDYEMHTRWTRREVPREHDRFIPQRQAQNGHQVNNFDTKEILFS